MKICVVGAGAIGGLLGAKLALAGEEVTLIDRGAHLEAIRRNGLKLVMADGTEHVAENVRATDDFTAAGRHELVILAVKAYVIEHVAPQLPRLFEADGMLLTAQNGLPWWYFQRHGGPYDGRRIECLDPRGTIARHVEPGRIIGCVVYPAGEIRSPGVVRHVEGDRFAIGEPDGSKTERVQRVADALARAGFKAFVLDNIRAEIWLKLWGNMSFNPISALTHATLEDICRFAPTRELAATMMREAQAIAGKLGIEFRVPIEKRIAGAEKVGAHKTSTLQDIEAGREIENEALLGAVIELARLTATPAPACETVYALLCLLGKTMLGRRSGVRLIRLAA
ncbi:MAG: 2-dehydropantoate 2-reductase [Betaproteobacteria bacterium]|nr:2-dehydropantoate 2-reductase [Betaproteobacteria bacterium]